MFDDEQVAVLPLGVPVVTKEGFTICVAVWPEQRHAKVCVDEVTAQCLELLDGDGLLEYVQAAVRVGELFEEKGFRVTY